MKAISLSLFMLILIFQTGISKAEVLSLNLIQKEKFTGKIDTSRQQDYIHSEQCLNYPTHYFVTNEGGHLLIVFLNQKPENGSIMIEGFFQEINNSCTKGGSNHVFMVSNFIKVNPSDLDKINTTISTVGSKLTQKQAQEALDLHNEARTEVGVSVLIWSTELAITAQNWADHLAQNGCEMEHSESSYTGENLYWTSRGGETSAADAVRAWYSEKKDFKNFPLAGNNWHKTGHYSQMVWKTTTHVGMAAAKCNKGQAIVVANYSPPGNYMGETAY